MAEVFDEWLKYVVIDLEILGNGKNIWKMAQLYEERLKYFRYGIRMLKRLKYLKYGFDVWWMA